MTFLSGLRVSYQRSRPFAAYLYLRREQPARVVRSRRFEAGIVADFSANGQCVGLELTAPAAVDPTVVNRILQEVGAEPVALEELQPLFGTSAA